jgi:uncharacterized protein (DUF4213/DUF364 family)
MPRCEILTETIEIIRNVAADEIGKLTIERAVVGLFFAGVKLSTGHVGACATPVKTIPDAVCCPTSAHAMPFPGKMRGRRAADFLDEVQHQDGIHLALGIAAMNAVAAFCWDRKPHPAVDLEPDVDAFDAARIAPDQMVVVVGAFVPFLRELKRRGNPYLVLEQDPAALKADELPFYRPASQAPIVVLQADVILIPEALQSVSASYEFHSATSRSGPTRFFVMLSIGVIALLAFLVSEHSASSHSQ